MAGIQYENEQFTPNTRLRSGVKGLTAWVMRIFKLKTVRQAEVLLLIITIVAGVLIYALWPEATDTTIHLPEGVPLPEDARI